MGLYFGCLGPTVGMGFSAILGLQELRGRFEMLSGLQLIEQGLGLFQIERVEALG